MSKNSPGNNPKVPLTYYRSAQKPAANNRSPFKAKEPTRNHLRKTTTVLINGIVIVLIGAGFLYSLLVKPDALINLNAQTYHQKSVYQEAANKELGKLKNHNKITLDEASIVSSLQKQFPEITSAAVVLPIFSQVPTLNINIAGPSFTLKSNGQSYIVNSQGVATADNSKQALGSGLSTVEDQTGFKVVVGKQVLSASEVTFINNVIAQSKHAKVPVKSLTLPPLVQELNLYTSDQPYYVKFYLGGDSMQQMGQFLATRKQLKDTKVTPAEYLDVRVPGKIFYK
jgi:hypothetical protein